MKFYLSNLAAAIKARWVCEQAHQQLKQELGLGHFEGRSWTGLHRHALMICIACAYLQQGEKMPTRMPARHSHQACPPWGAPFSTATRPSRSARSMSALPTQLPAAATETAPVGV